MSPGWHTQTVECGRDIHTLDRPVAASAPIVVLCDIGLVVSNFYSFPGSILGEKKISFMFVWFARVFLLVV